MPSEPKKNSVIAPRNEATKPILKVGLRRKSARVVPVGDHQTFLRSRCKKSRWIAGKYNKVADTQPYNKINTSCQLQVAGVHCTRRKVPLTTGSPAISRG